VRIIVASKPIVGRTEFLWHFSNSYSNVHSTLAQIRGNENSPVSKMLAECQ